MVLGGVQHVDLITLLASICTKHIHTQACMLPFYLNCFAGLTLFKCICLVRIKNCVHNLVSQVHSE